MWRYRSATTKYKRAEFNACGESSATATSYTAVPVRPFNELPRMSVAVKSSILGVAAAGAVRSKRLQRSCDLHGPPFSMTEVRPINLVARLFTHLGVTHVVDYCAGSGTIAIAAAGVQEYEGVAGSDEHRDWLDTTLDKCVMYLAGQNKEIVKSWGGADDEDFTKNMSKYFGDTLMEVRRMMGDAPVAVEEEDIEESEDSGVDA